MAQQGYVNTGMVRAHMEPFMPGQIATLYPKAIKTGVFRESEPGKILKFGVACGRKGASNTTVYTPNNFGESMQSGTGPNDGVPEYGPTQGTNPAEYRRNMATYAAGGGAYVTDKVEKQTIPAGRLKAVFTTNSDTVQIENDGTAHYDRISVGDYIRIVDDNNNRTETVRIAKIDTIGADNIIYDVLRAVSGYSKASGTLAVNSKVYIVEGGGNPTVSSNFAGVVIKDITIDGRWVDNEYDAFVDGDHVPVGVEGDYAVRVCGIDDNTQAEIKADDPVSIYIGPDRGYDSSIRKHPRFHGYFSNETTPSEDYIVIPGARFTTGHADITTTNPGTRGPGSGWTSEPPTVRCAVARFAGNV